MRTKSFGLFEKVKNGLLVPTRKILAAEQTRRHPLHVAASGQITDVTKSVQDEAYALAKDHYERLRGKAIISKGEQNRLRGMVSRASESIMEKKHG